MIEITRTDSDDPEFRRLVEALDTYLAIADGADHIFYAAYNTVDTIKNVVLAYVDGVAVGCGAFKKWDAETVEIKRMFTLPEHRGKGIATLIVDQLEQWAQEMAFTRCVLETGKRQPEAIALYEKQGYRLIPNYGQYVGMENSVCFEKEISIII